MYICLQDIKFLWAMLSLEQLYTDSNTTNDDDTDNDDDNNTNDDDNGT